MGKVSMSDNLSTPKKRRSSAIVQAGLIRFAELQEENDRLSSEIAQLQSKIERMTANDARTQQELAESKQEAARYMRSYTELLTSLNNAVMVLNTAQENARMTA